MVARRGFITAAVAVFIAAAVVPLTAEGDLSLELGLSSLILETRKLDSEDSYWGSTTYGSGEFSFKSQGNRNVKADLAFSFTAPEFDLGAALGGDADEYLMPMLSLDRAYVKARFPSFRITAGKTRLGWGDGFVFNSGDVIFGSTDTSVDLTASEVRTDTDWLAAVNVPLGRFSFIEGVALAPETDTAEGYSIGRIEKVSGGGRFYTKLAGVKIEGGYFFDQTGDEASSDSWENALHRPYIGVQGNILADLYLAASSAFPVDGDTEAVFQDNLNISAGIFHMVSLNSISSLTFRLEGLCRPYLEWEELTWSSGEDSPTYALLLYPEIGYTPTDTVSLSVRSIWSPLDMSAMITAGAGWNVFEGFDLSCYAVFNAGDSDDSFAWERSDELWDVNSDVIDSAAVIIGVNYIY